MTVFSFWNALGDGDSPGVRTYLRNLMLDGSKPQPYRELAGSSLFSRFGPEERFQEYLRVFDTRLMTYDVLVGVTQLLLKEDASRLLRDVGGRVRANPDLADQGAFSQIVESSDRFAPLAARQALADDLEAGLQQSSLPDVQRERLARTVWALRQPRR